MDNHNPPSGPTAEPGPAASDLHRDGTAGGDPQNDRLDTLLARWEERYARHEDASPESLGVRDPALALALLGRINERKRLYAGLSTKSAPEVPATELDDAQAPPEISPAPPLTERHDEPSIDTQTQVDPPYIGRYRVTRVLGQGAFGRVYLAHDTELDRPVAIKVPLTHQAALLVDFEAYLNEARILARLSHANIVPVYDVGHTEQCGCYVVSKYIDGGDLAGRLARGRPAFSETAELVAVLCDALHYAHTRDLFHRDIKPANILINAAGVPYLADFGLALKDENFGKSACFVGTAAYTSPEQARGEGHLVDGRSDIFSLGIVFYEMLTWRRPFRGDSIQEIMRQIISSEPRPPRQIDDTIPKELERICMKALSKRAFDRYSTARDMAEDLRHFRRTTGAGDSKQDFSLAEPGSSPGEPHELPPTTVVAPAELPGRPIRIMPKGLCSFDEHDADFFLELLPGPRDRDGLPDGLRFWKTRIEATDPDKTFRVGVIYGPSGCGKSSLVKAGLLPRLRKHVTPVYLEATAGETESRLLRGIRKAYPGLTNDQGLVETFLALRRGPCLPRGCKVLVVLDQFEQWLFARRHEQGTELVAALRQCDGEKLQALCLVRDDFWMAATRLTRDLEIDLVPNRNIAVVDLFEPKHARKVLAAFGRAYEALPPAGEDEPNKEQHAFLDQAVSELAQDGQVVPVRLALFAEMVKAKPWTPATLKEVGGMEGVGVKFLEETFCSARSSPRYRYHQKAAQAVLKSLLPETNADIKGRMRSIEELWEVSGYIKRPGDFDDLIRVLDNDLGLITPVDLYSATDADAPATRPAEGRFYQLTHDYLVHSLRDWLTRKQRETRRGRAELLLAERSALWNAKPERLHLPSAREWIRIRMSTRRHDWTGQERLMMRRAGRVHGRRLLGLFTLLVLLGSLAVGIHVYSQTGELLVSFRRTDVEKIPEVLAQLEGYPRWIYSRRLRALVERPENDLRSRLGYSLALLPEEPGRLEYLYQRLLAADPAEMAVLRDRLEPYHIKLSERLWSELRSARPGDARILPMAGVLARYQARSPAWAEVADKVALGMVKGRLDDAKGWREALWNVRDALLYPLARIFREKTPAVEHTLAATLLARYAEDRPDLLVDLLLDADPQSFSILFPVVGSNTKKGALDFLRSALDQPQPQENERAKDQHAARRARAAVALVRLGQAQDVWPILEHGPDPRSRSALINWLVPLGAEPSVLAGELERLGKSGSTESLKVESSGDKGAYLFDPATSKRRALILALAALRPEALDDDDRDALVETLLKLYRDDPDAGTHAAARLVLLRWGLKDHLEIQPGPPPAAGDPRRWWVDKAGTTMVKIDGPVDFQMGSRPSDPERLEEEILHHRIIPRGFAIAALEVTIDQFQKYAMETRGAEHPYNKTYSPDRDGPQIGVSWFEAAAFCNWASDREGLPRCYLPNDRGEFAEGMRVDAEAVQKGGIRLPTEAEWEYACRAGAVTTRYYGNSPDLLGYYEWYVDNSGFRAHSCGLKLPNDLGCFDMLGNVSEWCHDRHSDYKPDPKGIIRDTITSEKISGERRDFRGDRFAAVPAGLRCASRIRMSPGDRRPDVGFRIAGTLP